MGQKTHPTGFRLGVIRTWDSKWFEEKNYADWLHEDLALRNCVKKKHYSAGIAKVEIERAASKVKVNIFTARPGIVIGKKGAGIEQLKKDLQRLTENEVFINIQEIRKAETNAQLVAENIATQLERRIAFRRAMKKALTIAMKFGAKGIRVACSGRLGGTEMSRYEWYLDGRVPLHTLRAGGVLLDTPLQREVAFTAEHVGATHEPSSHATSAFLAWQVAFTGEEAFAPGHGTSLTRVHLNAGFVLFDREALVLAVGACLSFPALKGTYREYRNLYSIL